ncbi:MAG: glutamate synthase subunit alpha, partial [Acidimicrobiia bacterium]
MARHPQAERAACGIGFVADAAGQGSRAVVEQALTGLACVRHRQAIAADGLSGDGAGLLTPIPRSFFARVGQEALGTELDADRLGVVTAFLDHDDTAARAAAEKAVTVACEAEGLEVAGWRLVPIDEDQLGAHAAADLPAIVQALLLRPEGISAEDAERRAYRARRAAEAQAHAAGLRSYFASFSFSTVTYKALVISDRLATFYPDLGAPDFDAPLAVFHSRFSTNTTPAWERAQPFRMLCHNGEINTLQGNENRMRARGRLGTEDAGLGEEAALVPVLDASDSDSGKLDATVELL